MTSTPRVTSGTDGLDDVLDGGFIRGQTAIVSGGPGTGKTVLALQFLAAADRGLYIGFEEREEDIRENAARLDIDLSNVEILDLSADGSRFFESDDEYTIFPHEEVEGEALLDSIADEIDDIEPDRLAIDPLSELRSLVPDDYRFRRNISSLVNELKARDITTVCTTQAVAAGSDWDLQFLGDATLEIDRTTNHRSLEVTKFRGSDFANGKHTYRIRGDTGGRIYPKLVPGEHRRETDREQLSSGVSELDALLGGGIERGSVTVISGPSGVGKTTLGSLFLRSSAAGGTPSAGFLFEELRDDYLYRADQLGLGVGQLHADGPLRLFEVESLTQSPDEFAADVREAVEGGVEVVMIDGIPGYRLGLRGSDTEQELTRELHALCRYLKRMGVTTILIDEVGSLAGSLDATDERVSYLADNIIFLRYVEMDGEIRKVVGVLKKRFSDFEQSLRELRIDTDGVTLGGALTDRRGILTGVPERIE
ncbi:ATPase domain-containing protein [Halosegnis longus]|uniref:ATPase domain-containing protein n=1 Tax=Halosegnis longus TaxID=2216012 RepID=UPI00129DBBD3|nr:ATPase domain-containing protein [Halosegnis longus]